MTMTQDKRGYTPKNARCLRLIQQSCTHDVDKRIKANIALLREHMKGRDKNSLIYRRALAAIEALKTGRPYRGPAPAREGSS